MKILVTTVPRELVLRAAGGLRCAPTAFSTPTAAERGRKQGERNASRTVACGCKRQVSVTFILFVSLFVCLSCPPRFKRLYVLLCVCLDVRARSCEQNNSKECCRQLGTKLSMLTAINQSFNHDFYSGLSNCHYC